METINLEELFPDNPDIVNAANAAYSFIFEKFDSADKLVNEIAAIFFNYRAMLTSLTDAFASGEKCFELKKKEDEIIACRRYQTLIDHDWLNEYLTPTFLPAFIAVWKQVRNTEPYDLRPLINELNAYETAWTVFADALTTASHGSLASMELGDAVREMLREFHLVITATKENDHLSLWLHAIKKVKGILKEIAAVIARIDIDEEKAARKKLAAEGNKPKRAKYSQKLAAKLLGVTESTIQNWENGRSAPPVGYSVDLRYDPFDAFIDFAESYHAMMKNEALARQKRP